MILLTSYLYDSNSFRKQKIKEFKKWRKKVKDYYDLAYARDLSRRLQEASPAFDGQKFRLLLEKDLENLEFSQRQEFLAKVSKNVSPYLTRTPSRFLRKF